MIEIDGSSGEGGGQILRSSLALAAVLGKEVRIFNIRAGRSNPGLRPQHLTGAKAVAELCHASYRGLDLDSTEFVFNPGEIRDGTFQFDVGTAGSITLVLQALMPLLPFAPGKIDLEIQGGTDVMWSPPIDYVRMVVSPLLSRMGSTHRIQVMNRGHYPKGGGRVKISSEPSEKLTPLKGADAGGVTEIRGVSHSVKLPRYVAERQMVSAIKAIVGDHLPRPEIEIDASDNGAHLGPGSGLMLWAGFENRAIMGGDCLGERGLPAEEVGRKAAQYLIQAIHSGCFLDRHMGDMIVPFLALASGTSDLTISEVTQHTLTNIRVAETVARVKFSPVGELGKAGKLSVNGLGLKNSRATSSPTEPHLIEGS